MGKITVSDVKGKQRHNPLIRDIEISGGNLRNKDSKQKHASLEEDSEFFDAASSKRILQLAKEQQKEIEEEDNVVSNKVSFIQRYKQQLKEQEKEEEDEDEEEYSDFSEEEDEILEEEIEVDDKDAAIFEEYMKSTNLGGSFNLADKIMAKLHEHEELKAVEKPKDAVLLPPKVIEAYQKIGQILSSYTHGKLPKLFKVIPSLRNWEDVLFVTNPEGWTPHAVYEGTKLFVSNLSANEARKFIEMVLLERFRASIEDSEDHTLNYHLYRALKKSLYKPSAFFKGFLFPLVDSHCSSREATIAASVLSRVSIPVLHSSVALSQLTRRDFSPSTTVFIRVLIEKKYALPYQTLDDLVFYFMKFRDSALSQDMMSDSNEEKREIKLPVVWHKAFLAFAQRYKNDIADDQRDFLLETLRQRFHHAIGPEIRRELLAGKPREATQKAEESAMTDVF